MQLFTENSQPIRAETRIHAWVGCCFIIRLVSLNSTWNSTLSTNLLNNNGITNGEHMLERPRFGTLSVLLLAATSTPTCQVVADVWHCKDTIHAFISSRLDYCNSLLYGVGDGMLKKLQAIQNAVTWVVTGAKSSTTSRRCFVIFTGFQSARESSTNWLWQFISACAD